jgi:serine/threonine-protein kinase RIO1
MNDLKKSKRTRRGGVILYKKQKQDIMPELIRYAHGDISFVNNGTYGITFQLESDVSTILTRNGCSLTSILVKLIAIDSPLHCGETELIDVDVDDFRNEVSIQQDIGEASLKKFNCSIVPTVLHAGVYTYEELMTHFPKIGVNVTTLGRIGIIFMENISDSETISDLIEKDKRTVTEFFFPRMRRMLIMLAQLGFLHNDYNLTNWLVSGEALLLIDFGMATRIDTFDEKDVTSIISFLSVDTDEQTKRYKLQLQWLRQEQIDTFTDVIDPDVRIAPQLSITGPLHMAERELCIVPKMPAVEKEYVLSKTLPKVPLTKLSSLATLRKTVNFYQTLPLDLKRDPDIIRASLTINGESLFYVPEELRDEDNVRIAVRNRGWSLKDVPNVLKTKEIVTLAVRNRGIAIQFSPENLKSDPDIIRAAVSKDGTALKFVPKDKITKEIASIAVSNNGNALHFIPRDIIDDEIILSAIMNNGDSLKYVPKELITKEIILTAVTNRDDEDVDLFQYFPQYLKEDRQFLFKVLKIDGTMVRFMNSDDELLAHAKYSDKPVRLTQKEKTRVVEFLRLHEQTEDIMTKFRKEYSGGKRNRKTKRR